MPRKKQNIGEELQTWVIKDVDKGTRQLIRVYAARHDLTTAQALKAMVLKAQTLDDIIGLLEVADDGSGSATIDLKTLRAELDLLRRGVEGEKLIWRLETKKPEE